MWKLLQVDHPEPQDVMLLTCEGWWCLHCKRVVASDPEPPVDSSFSLLPALEDGYFSDLSITASNNKQVSQFYSMTFISENPYLCGEHLINLLLVTIFLLLILW